MATDKSSTVIGYLGYARVSTDEQAKEGVSLDLQRDKIEAYAALHDLRLIAVEADPGASAKSLDRPGLVRVLAKLDSGEAGGLVIFKLDRLTRSINDWSYLIDRYFGERGGKSLMSVCESINTRDAAGRMVLNIMMTVAQWEREAIVERTQAAMNLKRERGERLGTIPFGYRINPDGRRSAKTGEPIEIMPDPDEQVTLRDICRWRAQKVSLRNIADWLNASHIRSRSGRPWSPSTIHSLPQPPAE